MRFWLFVLIVGCQRQTSTFVDVPPPAGSAGSLPPMASALPTPSPSSAPITIGFREGQSVEVEWHGDWWPAHVVVVRSSFPPTYAIHYDGYDDSWNEDVGLDRIRSPEPADER